ncbi:MAG: type IX secretion system PorP/SprF family membrane protein [Saprospiraceae bacterium]|jgi:type IX secretion system PorP/SprF family membrane protein
MAKYKAKEFNLRYLRYMKQKLLEIKRLGHMLMLLGMAFCIGGTITAQDIHFTNFRMAPLSINPALTGAFEGTYRVSAIYRDQWTPIDNSRPFKTPFVSGEFNMLGGVLLDHDWVSGGISFQRDQAGSLNMKNQMTALNVGYHIGMDKDYSRVFSFGVTYGSMNRGIDLMGITPEAVENTITGGIPVATQIPGVSGGPGEAQQSISFTTLSVGVAYKTQLESGGLIRFGLNAGHINNPDASIFKIGGGGIDSMGGVPIVREKDGFGPKIVLHGEGSFVMNEKVRLNPALIFQSQNGFRELAVQTTADYMLNREKQMVAIGGLGYRLGDAVELMGGVQIKDLRVMLSYDLTTSSLTQAGGGAFELAVGYVGRIYRTPQVKPVIFCPRL